MGRASSMTTRSTLAKKCALSFTMGPPRVNPYCWKVVSGLASPFCRVKKSFWVSAASCTPRDPTAVPTCGFAAG